MSAAAGRSTWAQFWERGGFLRALLLAAGYLALYLAAGWAIHRVWADRIDTTDVLSSAASVFFAIALPILVGIALLGVFAVSVGWLGELFARQPIGGRWWMWIPPIVVLAYNVVRFAAVDYRQYAVTTVIMVLFAGLCVGVAEEVLTRGFAVTLLRKAGYRERAVAMLSSLIFAALHTSNLLSGQAPVVVGLTVIYTFAFGIAMYLTLRVTRHLIWPILLHASTDPSGLLLAGGIDTAGGTTTGSPLAAIAGTSNWAVIVVCLVLVWFVRGQVGDRGNVPGSVSAGTPGGGL